MSYTKFFKQSPNYTRGSDSASIKRWWPASGGKREIKKIAIHWWDDPRNNPSFEGVVNTLTDADREASAHYVATGSGKRVAQLVREGDVSWATNSANWFTISIECDPRCRDADYSVIGELIADIWKRHGKIGLVPHNKYSATRCPGNYSLKRLTAEANKWFEKKYISKPEPKPVSTIRYQKFADTRKYHVVNKDVTLWNFNAPTWKLMKAIKTIPRSNDGKRTVIEITGKATHPTGSIYLMTPWSYNKNGEKSKAPFTTTGFNQLDLVKVKDTPPEPIDDKPTPAPEPPENDQTNQDSVEGGNRQLETRIQRLEVLYEKLVEFLSNIVKNLKGL